MLSIIKGLESGEAVGVLCVCDLDLILLDVFINIFTGDCNGEYANQIHMQHKAGSNRQCIGE